MANVEIVIQAEGLDAIKHLEEFGDNFRKNLARAVNRVTTEARTDIEREIEGQTAIPKSELSPRGGNLIVSKKASPSSLEGRVLASGKARGLATFSSGGTIGQPGTVVTVKRANPIFLSKAFFVSFDAGKKGRVTGKEPKVGLAVRLKEGERIANKVKSIKVGPGLHVLAGVNVPQAVRGRFGTGIAKDLAPEIAIKLEKELQRLTDVFGT